MKDNDSDCTLKNFQEIKKLDKSINKLAEEIRRKLSMERNGFTFMMTFLSAKVKADTELERKKGILRILEIFDNEAD